MSILSGYKRFKKYLRTGDGYKLCSEWTNADSVEMADGTTLQESMDTVVGDVESTQNELKTSLGGMTFGVDAAGRYGYIKAGADTVTPFKSHANVINFTPQWELVSKSTPDPYASVAIGDGFVRLTNQLTGSHVGFSATFQSVEQYDFEGCVGFLFDIYGRTDGTIYNYDVIMTINDKVINPHFLLVTPPPTYHFTYMYLNEETRPKSGNNRITVTIQSTEHTTGYPATWIEMAIKNWYLIT